MSRITRKGPSPAMIVAVVSLSFALAGSAIAGTGALDRAVNKSKVRTIAKKQANKILNQREGSLNVASANNANNANNANQLDNLGSNAFLRSGSVLAEGNASSADVDNFTTNTYTTTLSEPFTAPSAGFALITASVGAADDSTLAGNGALWSRIAIDGTATTADPFNAPPYDGPFVAGGGTATNTVVVPVTAGDHTAHLQIRESGTGSFVYTRQITVLFVPTGDAGPVPYSSAKDAGSGGGPQG